MKIGERRKMKEYMEDVEEGTDRGEVGGDEQRRYRRKVWKLRI